MSHTSAKKIDGVEAASWIQTLTNGSQPSTLPLRLYFHIPFCTKKCPYCHFFSVADNEELKDQLLEALLLEIKSYLPIIKQHKVISCYFGGGTPYLFQAKRIQAILDELRDVNCLDECQEITLEANPEQVTQEEMDALYNCGVNRISFGVQSFQPEDLQLLQRGHSLSSVQNAISMAIAGGISNISIDLIYDIPHQTKKMWFNTVTKALELPVTHMSLYNLTIEPNTPFWRKKNELIRHMPGDVESAERCEETVRLLEENGFSQYEISAFSKKGQNSLHNVGYWIGHPYLGFGPSASGFYGTTRYANISNVHRYCEAMQSRQFLFDYIETESPAERLKELIAVGLRYYPGVDISKLEKIVDATITKETMLILTTLEKDGLIVKNHCTIQLTERGKVMYDTVASMII